jgi:hypothetical protein
MCGENELVSIKKRHQVVDSGRLTGSRLIFAPASKRSMDQIQELARRIA